MKRCILLFFYLLPLISMAQVTPNSFGFSAFSGQNGVAKNDAFSIVNNPAMMQADSLLLGLSAENVFTSNGLFHFAAAGQAKTKFGNVGIGLHRFGDELMNETTATVGISRQLLEEMHIGVGLHYFATQAQYTPSASTLYPQLGLTYELSEAFRLGFSARNPLSQDLKRPFEQNLQSLYSLGFLYKSSTELSTTLQTDIWEKDGLAAGFGLQYQPFDRFQFSIGGKTNPGIVTAGITVNLNQLQLGIGGKQQSPLGTSPLIVMQSAF